APARRKRWRWLGGLVLLLVVVVGAAWLTREQIAHRIIAGQLEDLGLPGRYEIESVGAQRQVLNNIVIGDPARPDLIVPRMVIEFEPRLGVPTLGRVTLEGARLRGTYKAGKLSFGALDPVIFAKRDGPAGLPDLDLVLIDGRARIDSDYGVLGAKASAYGKITTVAAKARFAGPLRLKTLRCADQALALGQTTLQLDAQLGEAFDTAKGRFDLTTAAPVWQGYRAARIAGDGDFSFAGGDLVASHDLTGTSLDLGGASLGTASIDGVLRSRDRMARFEGEGAITGRELRTGAGLGAALADVEKSGEGTLIAPLARQLRNSLSREERGSELAANYSLRQTGGVTQIVVPLAELHGGSGTRLVGLSRFGLSLGMKGGPRFSGNFVTGGAGLPRMKGTARRNARGGVEARLSLAEYRAGDASVALPDLRLVQLPSGQIGFGGRAFVSGALPGGEVRGLTVPVDGTWTQRQGLAAWRRCTPISFDRFKVGNLALEQRGLTLCPGPGGAILRSDRAGTRLSAGTAGLNLAGTLGTTPIRLKSGAVGFAWPGKIAARAIDVSMGPLAEPSTLKVASFDGTLGKVITGRFTGTELKLFPVPLDVYDGAGELRFANQKLAITGASLMVKDRETDARFYPLLAREATVDLVSTTFTARAMLRHPASDREVVETLIVHDLDTGVGHADLNV
ncbi:MAG: C4-dicarboxylate ABC transporter, partial [Sphingomonadaceae bacterium]|nr:C4-dicarboxylate ABC transporter [Sphingomonadaceae bacterium]